MAKKGGVFIVFPNDSSEETNQRPIAQMELPKITYDALFGRIVGLMHMRDPLALKGGGVSQFLPLRANEAIGGSLGNPGSSIMEENPLYNVNMSK